MLDNTHTHTHTTTKKRQPKYMQTLLLENVFVIAVKRGKKIMFQVYTIHIDNNIYTK